MLILKVNFGLQLKRVAITACKDVNVYVVSPRLVRSCQVRVVVVLRVHGQDGTIMKAAVE